MKFLGIGFLENFVKCVWLLFNFAKNNIHIPSITMGKYSNYTLNYYVKVLLPPMKVGKLYVHLFIN